MADPVTTNLNDLESSLEKLAQPNKGSDGTYKTGSATATGLTPTITALLTDLYKVDSPLITAVKAVGGDIHDGLGLVVKVLQAIGDGLAKVAQTGADGQAALDALKNVLAVAQTLVPGSSTALSSGSQFFGTISNLLSTTTVTNAADVLYKIAQQLQVIGDAIKPT